MDLDTFVVNFAGQLDNTPEEMVTADTIFRDIPEWSSMTALLIIAMIGDEYGVTLEGDDVRNAVTVRDVFNAVVAKK